MLVRQLRGDVLGRQLRLAGRQRRVLSEEQGVRTASTHTLQLIGALKENKGEAARTRGRVVDAEDGPQRVRVADAQRHDEPAEKDSPRREQRLRLVPRLRQPLLHRRL